MTDTPVNQRTAGTSASAPDDRETSGVLAPRVTRAASIVVMAGVLVQAAIAGGFLAGHPWTDIHMIVGIPLVLSALVLVAIGTLGRRHRPEPRSVLLNRLGVLVALATTAIVGILAGQGTRDLLMVHIPLAIISMGLAARLMSAVRLTAPDPERHRASVGG